MNWYPKQMSYRKRNCISNNKNIDNCHLTQINHSIKILFRWHSQANKSFFFKSLAETIDLRLFCWWFILSIYGFCWNKKLVKGKSNLWFIRCVMSNFRLNMIFTWTCISLRLGILFDSQPSLNCFCFLDREIFDELHFFDDYFNIKVTIQLHESNGIKLINAEK